MISEDSRYLLSDLVLSEDQELYTSLRDRITYDDIEDVLAYSVKDGDTLHSVATKFYGQDGATFWWAIADFQPDPINDPTVKLVSGQILFIPPLAEVHEVLLGIDDDDVEVI